MPTTALLLLLALLGLRLPLLGCAASAPSMAASFRL